MKAQEWLHLVLLLMLYFLGVLTGMRITEPELEVVSRNTGTCTGCGSATIVEIKEKR